MLLRRRGRIGYGKSSGFSVLSVAQKLVEDDSGDVGLLVIGDSTGNDSTDWVYKFAQWLASAYPTHTVIHRPWDDTNNVYAAGTTMGTGSGSNTINVWNACISSTSPIYLMGAKLALSITATNPDVVIWNHGQNLINHGTASLRRGEILAAMEQVRQALPGVPHAAIRQNPRRDDDQMAVIIDALDGVVASYGDMSSIDVYSRFLSAGKASELYTDNIHPSNGAGTQIYVDTVKEAWLSASVERDVIGAFLDSAGTNLLVNSNFSDPSYIGGRPTGWANATATMTADTSVRDAGKTQSMKFTHTTTAVITQDVANITTLKGAKATYAVRQYVPPGQTATTGRIALLYNDGSNTIISSMAQGTLATGAFRWMIISGLAIPQAATVVRAYLYCDTSTASGSIVYYDRAVLVAGDVPRDLA